MGKDERMIIKQCTRRNQPLPKKIKEAPVLMTGLGLYFEAFNELDSCRSYGMAIGPIPWSFTQDYAVTNEFSKEQADDLHYFIQKMDVAYRKHLSKDTK